MSVDQLTQMILLGGLMGLLGQVVRIAIGMKKMNDVAADMKVPASELFEGRTLTVSLLIGFAAGAFTLILASENELQCTPSCGSGGTLQVPEKLLIGLAAAGYAGTDVLEGIFNRFFPKGPKPPAAKPAPEPDSGSAASQPPAMG